MRFCNNCDKLRVLYSSVTERVYWAHAPSSVDSRRISHDHISVVDDLAALTLAPSSYQVRSGSCLRKHPHLPRGFSGVFYKGEICSGQTVVGFGPSPQILNTSSQVSLNDDGNVAMYLSLCNDFVVPLYSGCVDMIARAFVLLTQVRGGSALSNSN